MQNGRVSVRNHGLVWGTGAQVGEEGDASLQVAEPKRGEVGFCVEMAQWGCKSPAGIKRVPKAEGRWW